MLLWKDAMMGQYPQWMGSILILIACALILDQEGGGTHFPGHEAPGSLTHHPLLQRAP